MAGVGSGPGRAEFSSPALSLPDSVALSKSHHLSGPASLQLHNEEAGQMVSDRVPSISHALCPVLSRVLSSSLFM